MTKTLVLLAIVAFGVAAAWNGMGAKNGVDHKHGHKGHGHGGDDHHGRRGPHFGPPPEVMKKMMFMKPVMFVHMTYCAGLPGPNFTRPNDTRMGGPMRKPMFREMVADASESGSSSESGSASESDSSSSEENDKRPKPNATVLAEADRLKRVVMRAVSSVIFSAKEGSSEDECKAMVKAEQAYIDFRKANNMSCDGGRKHGRHGPHGPRGPPRGSPGSHGPQGRFPEGPFPAMNGGAMNMPPLPQFSAAVMPSKPNMQGPPARFGAPNARPMLNAAKNASKKH